MDLFESLDNTPSNLLPSDGEACYYGMIMSQHQADHYFDALMQTIQWQHDEAFIMGKKITTKRKVAWYGEKAYTYTYSNVTKTALPWTKELLELKDLVEQTSNENFNACLLNLYHDGSEGLGWHSDAEKALKKDGTIASISLGARRKFAFKHRQSKETISLFLGHGSLLVMKGKTQALWLHRLPPTKKVKTPRINLTFRKIII